MALGCVVAAAPAAVVSTRPIIKRLFAMVSKLEEEEEAQVLSVQVDTMVKGQPSAHTHALSAGSTYKIIAVGDQERVNVIQLRILDEDDNEVAKNEENPNDEANNVAFVDFEPDQSGKYKLQVVGKSMRTKDAFYGIIVSRKPSS